jgi:cytochrome P450
MIAAGHETTSDTLSWCFYLLSRHPEVERRLHEEVRTVLGDRVPALSDLPRLTYTACVLQEVMRLYPPVWIIERKALVEDDLLGYRIPAGATVWVFTYGLHRHSRYWDNPADFDPDRFAPERSEGRPRALYLPFGAGPRMCIGNNFAMMEGQIILSMIEQRFRVALDPGHKIEMEPLITLRPKYGIHATIDARQAAPSSTGVVTHLQDR